MSDTADQYEEYNYDQDKFTGHGGKHRTKTEIDTNKDTSDHTRITTQKLMNSHEKEKEAQKAKNEKAAAATGNAKKS